MKLTIAAFPDHVLYRLCLLTLGMKKNRGWGEEMLKFLASAVRADFGSEHGSRLGKPNMVYSPVIA